MNRADEGLKRRREIAAVYASTFEGISGLLDRNIQARGENESNGHAHHLYVIEAGNRAGIYRHLRENGVFAQIHYFPTHLMPYYRQLGWKTGDLPFAEAYYKKCISLPMYPTLTDEEISFVVNVVSEFHYEN